MPVRAVLDSLSKRAQEDFVVASPKLRAQATPLLSAVDSTKFEAITCRNPELRGDVEERADAVYEQAIKAVDEITVLVSHRGVCSYLLPRFGGTEEEEYHTGAVTVAMGDEIVLRNDRSYWASSEDAQ